MNKNIVIILAALALSGIFQADAKISSAQQLQDFFDLTMKHEKEWIKFGQKNLSEKKDLIIKEKEARVKFAKEMIEDWNKTTITTDTDKEAFFKKKLKNAIELREKHDQKMADFYKDWFKEGREIYEKHQRELGVFEGGLKAEKKYVDNENNEKHSYTLMQKTNITDNENGEIDND